MASSHLSHRIVIFKVFHTSVIAFKRLHEGHLRTPWCLTFDPDIPNILLSGCLAGVVCRWDVEVRSRSPLSCIHLSNGPLSLSLLKCCDAFYASSSLPSSQAGTLLGSWQSFQSPISSIAFLPSSSSSLSSGFVLVTVLNKLCLLSTSRLEVVYESSTVNMEEKIRLTYLSTLLYNYAHVLPFTLCFTNIGWQSLIPMVFMS